MSANGLLGKGKPAGLPAFVLYVRIAIIVLSVAVLGVAAYAISLFGPLASYAQRYTASSGLLIFVAILNWIVYGLLIFFDLQMPLAYPRVAFVGACTLSIIFCLVGWALSAARAAEILVIPNPEGNALGACAGLGALIWVLCIVDLVVFVRTSLADPPAPDAELGHMPKDAAAGVYPVAAQAPAPVAVGYYQAPPAAQYQQQPVHGQ